VLHGFLWNSRLTCICSLAQQLALSCIVLLVSVMKQIQYGLQQPSRTAEDLQSQRTELEYPGDQLTEERADNANLLIGVSLQRTG
jgi:hypothetical protein